MGNRQKILVTGGARRLGAEICRTLASKGISLLIHYNKSQAEARELGFVCQRYGVDVDIISGDFTTAASVEEFIRRLNAEFPDISGLVNNVGNYLIDSALATAPKLWAELFQINFHAPFTLIQSLIPSIKRVKGSIVNIGAAGLSSVPADTYSTAYTATKLALWMLTKSLAKELAPSEVSVNMVSPGLLDNSIDMPQDLSFFPMKRPGTSQEVAYVVAFLLEKNNSYITGQNIEVAGGIRLH